MDETEDEIIKRVGRAMFGDNVVLLPETLEIAKARYREIMEAMRENAA
jgi:hypothetical protein